MTHAGTSRRRPRLCSLAGHRPRHPHIDHLVTTTRSRPRRFRESIIPSPAAPLDTAVGGRAPQHRRLRPNRDPPVPGSYNQLHLSNHHTPRRSRLPIHAGHRRTVPLKSATNKERHVVVEGIQDPQHQRSRTCSTPTARPGTTCSPTLLDDLPDWTRCSGRCD